MHRYLKLYFMIWSQNLQSQMEYKTDFILGNIAAILGQVVGIAFVWIIFQRIGDLNGWSLPQIMLIYGLSALPHSLTALFFSGPWNLNYYVQMGEFDRFLVRPVSSLFLLLADEAAIHSLGNLLTGGAIIALASRELHLAWTLANIAFVLLVVLCGTVICISINLMTAAISFWFTGSGTALSFLVQRLREFSRYPLDIYALPIQVLLTWIIPFAFTSFFPAAFLLGRQEYTFFVYLIPLISIAFFVIACGIWRLGLNQYQSTGS
jgi:ABC-2 type transport system permease protein